MKSLLVSISFLLIACMPEFIARRIKPSSPHRSDGRSHPVEQTSTSLTLNRVSEFLEGQASDICAIRANSGQKAVIWLHKSAGLTDSKMELVHWQGEKDLASSLSYGVEDVMLGLSPLLKGSVYQFAGLEAGGVEVSPYMRMLNLQNSDMGEHVDLDFERTDEKTFNQEGILLSPGLEDLKKTMVRSWQRECPALLAVQMTASSELYVFMHSNAAVRLLKFKPDGALLQKRVIVPAVLNYDETDKELLLSQKESVLGLSFSLHEKQYAAFEAFHQISIPRDLRGRRDLIVLARLRSEGSSLEFRFLTSRSIDAMDWLDGERLLVSSHQYNKDEGRNKPELHLVDFRKPELLSSLIAISKDSAVMTDLAVLSGDRVLLAGTIDFVQASSWSIVKAGKAFVGVYDLTRQSFTSKQIWGGARDFRVTALAQVSSGEFLLGARENSWITHDLAENRSSNSALYRVLVSP